jgi:hypothetical protein
MLRRHPVGGVRVVEGVDGGPQMPDALVLQHHGVLDAVGLIALQDGPGRCRAQALGTSRLDDIDPPVLRAGCGAADVEPPRPVLDLHDGGPLEGLRAEVVLVEHGKRLEGQPVGRPRDDVAVSPTFLDRLAHPVGEVDRVIPDVRARRSRPMTRSRTGGGYDDGTVLWPLPAVHHGGRLMTEWDRLGRRGGWRAG